MGFGGVSEYGITVRWDKNFLALMYLTLLRRKNLRFYGGIRFGGTISLDDAWKLGFKHVALATGAGKPTIIDMKNNLSKGIRKASDFLMALQLTGAFKKPVMANLQVRLPALVIGGGLTGVDTATELLAYYPVQVEKVLERFDVLCREFGEESVWQMCDEEEREILVTFVEHGRAIRDERRAAEKKNARPISFRSAAAGAAFLSSIESASSTHPRTASITKRSRRRSKRASASSRIFRPPRPCATSTARSKRCSSSVSTAKS